MKIENVVELRVHGVSGTPAAELLDRPLVELAAGDTTAGFYRARLEAERDDDYPTGASQPQVRGPLLEGYVWGGLTSGAPSRAFWLLLLPFTLSNVAPRLRPAGCSPRRVWWIWYVSRLLALTLTVVLVTAFVGLGVDLVGWQCSASVGRCASASPGWLFDPITRLGTGRRIMVGALVPILGLLVLWMLSQRTINRYESVSAGMTGATDTVGRVEEIEPALDSPWMWDNAVPVRRLRGLHLQVGMAATVAMTGAVAHGAWQWLDGLLALAVIAYAVLALSRASFSSRAEGGRWHEAGYAIWAALAVAAAGTAWWLQRCTELPENPVRCGGGAHPACLPAGLPHFAETIVWLLLVELVLVAGVAILVAGRARTGDEALGEPGPKAGLFGLGAAVIAVMSVFLASVFTAAAYLVGAAWLTSGSLHPRLSTVSDVSRKFAVPEAILDAGLAYAVSIAILLACLVAFVARLGWAWVRLRAGSWPLVPGSYAKDYPGEPTDPRTTPRVKALLHDLFLGRVVDFAAGFLAVVVGLGAVLVYVFGLFLLLEHGFGVNAPARWLLDPVSRADLVRGIHPAFFSRIGLQGKGAYLAVVTLVLLVGLGAAAFRVQATRRSVGILWDLASFWPRLAHPLAAPCYAERTVPDIVNRIRWHAGDGRGVVLAGHSQGTVISAATIMQLRGLERSDPDGDVLGHVSLLTFGCVLRRLYGRYFPAYFGAHVLLKVGTGLQARWWNLWRYTDYLGGPVLSGPPPRVQPPWDPAHALPASSGPCVDLHLVDPPFSPPPGDPSTPAAKRHSDFPTVPEFQIAVSRLAELIPEPPLDGVSGEVGANE